MIVWVGWYTGSSEDWERRMNNEQCCTVCFLCCWRVAEVGANSSSPAAAVRVWHPWCVETCRGWHAHGSCRFIVVVHHSWCATLSSSSSTVHHAGAISVQRTMFSFTDTAQCTPLLLSVRVCAAADWKRYGVSAAGTGTSVVSTRPKVRVSPTSDHKGARSGAAATLAGGSYTLVGQCERE